MGEGDTLVNAVIGAAVGTVLSFLPFSPVLGGAVAGYLQKGSRREGIRVGAYAGLIALVPVVLLGALGIGLFVSVVPMTSPVPGMPGPMPGSGTGPGPGSWFGALTLAGVLVAVLSAVAYVVVLYAAGGWVGNYVVTDTDL